MIRRAVWQLSVAFVILAANLSSSVHAQCVQFGDPAEMFRLAPVVFAGTVRTTVPTGAHGFHVVMHQARFDVERVWKGQVRKVETVGTVEAFEPGKRYLVFARVANPTEVRPGQRGLTTSLECGWAELEGATGSRTQRWLTERAIEPTPPGND
jgi:hypothetical protein